MCKSTSRVNTAVLHYMDSLRSQRRAIAPHDISLLDDSEAVFDDQVLTNCEYMAGEFLKEILDVIDEGNSSSGSSVQMDRSESSYTDVGLSSDEGLQSDYSWHSDMGHYDLDGMDAVPMAGHFEEFQCNTFDIDPNTPPQWQDVDQYYDELMRLEGEENL
ncbi:unnamed protein product [Cylicostephanus goldi]|uniref:Uncharacterized protein n=1 Tax=Cylicostephanus goldi TaxID=71465 RepID=A0A3P6RQF1_CYLGO|nr:unnamed protein product [Cylicostephanus goldi]